MATVALELVPPDAVHGIGRVQEEAARVAELLAASGLAGRLNALVVPGMIAEESDRPIPLAEKLDPLDVVREARRRLPLEGIVTQVTAFSSGQALRERLAALREAGVGRVVFVGVPRTLSDGEGPGLAPSEALGLFRDVVPSRGAILIPSRREEKERFEAKVKAGADFALTQMLFSEAIVRLVPRLELPAPRPELLLSFAHVPRSEGRVGLIRWLIRDDTDVARDEMRRVAALAEASFATKRRVLVDLVRRVTDGLADCGYPLGLHFECPYGFNRYAFDLFHAMLDAFGSPPA